MSQPDGRNPNGLDIRAVGVERGTPLACGYPVLDPIRRFLSYGKDSMHYRLPRFEHRLVAVESLEEVRES